MKSLLFSLLALVALAVLACRRFTSRLSFPLTSDLQPCGDLYGTSATAIRTNPVTKVDVRNLGARVRYMNEVYTQGAADGAIGDVIHLPALPVGAKIIADLCSVGFAAGNAGALLALGKTGAATAIKAATSIAAAGTFTGTIPADGADDVTLAEGEELIATNSVAAIKAAQVIRFRIAYVENS